ncbi:DUF6879 family protein [Nocardia gipuzkoensis]
MRLYQRDGLAELFAGAKHRAFHLETRDEYLSSSEHSAMSEFLADETIDPGGSWFEPWAVLVSATTERGVAVERARIVTTPHGAYTRYLLALTPHNIAAGEEVRWLPRQDAIPADAAADDYWLIDDDLVAYSVFDENEWWSGVAATTDPVIVGYACELRDRVWAAATPHQQYQQ